MTTVHTIERRPGLPQQTPPPLLIMLHGYGSNEHDLMGLAPYMDDRFHIISSRAIYHLGFGYAWYHLSGVPGNLQQDDTSLAASLEVATKFVSTLPQQVGSDPRQTYLFGFSQGAVISLGVAMTIPEQVAGVIAISGYLDHKVIAPRVAPAALHHLHALVMHGTHDDVIPVQGGRAIRDFLENTPAHLAYHEYPIGHGIHPQALPVIQQWLGKRLAAH